MKIIVNAKEIEVSDSITILELLKNLQVENRVMAVALNMSIVKKDKWDSCSLKEGDKLELLHFVGGG